MTGTRSIEKLFTRQYVLADHVPPTLAGWKVIDINDRWKCLSNQLPVVVIRPVNGGDPVLIADATWVAWAPPKGR